MDAEDLANPGQAAGASALAFTVGGLLPLVAILLPGAGLRVPVTVVAVLLALALAGVVSARIGGSTAGARCSGWCSEARPLGNQLPDWACPRYGDRVSLAIVVSGGAPLVDGLAVQACSVLCP